MGMGSAERGQKGCKHSPLTGLACFVLYLFLSLHPLFLTKGQWHCICIKDASGLFVGRGFRAFGVGALNVSLGVHFFTLLPAISPEQRWRKIGMAWHGSSPLGILVSAQLLEKREHGRASAGFSLCLEEGLLKGGLILPGCVLFAVW